MVLGPARGRWEKGRGAKGRKERGRSQCATTRIPSGTGFRFDLPIWSQLGRSNWHAMWEKEIRISRFKISRFHLFQDFYISRLKLDSGR